MGQYNDYVTLCIGFGCNNRCIHCMLDGIKDIQKPIGMDTFRKVVDAMPRQRGLILSGGEVTIMDNLTDYVSYAKKRGIERIRIQTNARALASPKICKEIVESGVNEFFVSVYGHDAHLHDAHTATPGSFEETIKGIKNIIECKATLITNTVITSKNTPYLTDITKLLLRWTDLIEFLSYFPMAKEDTKDLIPRYTKVAATLSACLDIAPKSIVRYFPECLLGNHRNRLDNSLPRTIINSSYWERYKENEFGLCDMKERCSSKTCTGFPRAYINKYGFEKDLKPIP